MSGVKFENLNVSDLEGHEKIIICLDFSPNGKYIVSSSTDKTIILWDS